MGRIARKYDSFARRPATWLTVLRRYLGAMALGSLVWEFAHMPFYTLWESATPGGIALAAIHCTGGDVLIAVGALAASLLFFGTDDWPDRGYLRVALLAVAGGLTYTLFSEWLNVEVRQTWAYRDVMPIIPVLDVGLSPFAQWVVLPGIAFWWARRAKGKS